MARDTAEVIEQLMSQTNFTLMLYEIQVKDTGLCSVVGSTITDTTKTWITHEWETDTTIFTDVEGSRFIITDNTDTTITVAGVPVEGEYTVERWFFLSSHIEDIDVVGKPASITFGEDEFTRPKIYSPYPINHKMLHDHELGKFPQLQVSVYNPGTEAFSAYYDLDEFDFYSLFERYDALRGNIFNIIVGFIDSSGDIIIDPDTANILNSFTIMNSDITRDLITFTISSLGNFSDKKIPARTFSKTTCGWVYKGDKCLYTSSDSTLTTPITVCNKLLKSHTFDRGGLELYHEGAEVYFTTQEISTDMQSYVLGCIVESPKVPYLWRITAVTIVAGGTRLTITSKNNGKQLSDYLDDSVTDMVRVNIYEKECCFGHTDTGTTFTQTPSYGSRYLRGYCKYNELAFNGDFSAIGDTETIPQWSPTGDVTVASGYAFIVGAATISQQLYYQYKKTGPTDPDENLYDLPLETGKMFNLVFRYYGASIVSGETRSISYTLTANMDGTTYYWNATSNIFQIGSTSNSIELHPYQRRLGISNYTAEQKEYIRYFKFDEYISSVKLIAGSTSRVREMNLSISIPAGAEVVFNYVSCILHNQFERFGGFPSIPTTRFWYF